MPFTGKSFYCCSDDNCLYYNFYIDFIKPSNICPKCKQDTYRKTSAEDIVIRLRNKLEGE